MSPAALMIVLMLTGVILLGAEIYVPGGVLGTFGALSLIASVVVGFSIGPLAGWTGLGGIILLGVIGAYFWMQVFPRSTAGKRLTLDYDGSTFTTRSTQSEGYLGRVGVAQTELRPSGLATFDGRRVDVIAEHGEWLAAGTHVRVIRVSGSRIYVEADETANSA